MHLMGLPKAAAGHIPAAELNRHFRDCGVTLRRIALLGLVAAPIAARAQGGEATRPVRLIVPFPPGGSTDILGRAVAEHAQGLLGQPIIVDNRGGGAGVIGTEAAARAAPDGLTLVLGHNQTHASNQVMLARQPYHVIDSFAPVARLATVHHATVVPAASPARTMQDLVALGRSRRLSYASSTAGSASHVLAETLVRRTGMDAVHVPYRGAAPATTDTVAGVVDFYVATWPSVSALVRDGRLRALSIGAPERLAGFAGIPTAAEAGFPWMAVDAWFGVFAPRGTPDAAVQRLSAALIGALEAPEVAQRLRGVGYTIAPLGPVAFAAFQRAELDRWADMVQLTGVRLED